MPIKLNPGVFAFTLLLLFQSPGWAQQSLSADELARKLSARPETKTAASRGIVIEGTPQQEDLAPSVNLNISFESGSSKITTDSKILLDTLSQAIAKPELRNARFIIAGHTDAVGNDAFNLALSQKRAKAVATYMTNDNGVAADRLKVEGYGRTRLLDAANPRSAVNRRVQVINIGELR
jgi:outer membrane protein OmpA-like peptidoglycan-associated protein